MDWMPDMQVPQLKSRTELSLLVEHIGNCTTPSLGGLNADETATLVEQVFFGCDGWSHVQVDTKGNVTSLSLEAEHHLFSFLMSNAAFQELLSKLLSCPPVSLQAVIDYVHQSLSPEDPAMQYAGPFSHVVFQVLRVALADDLVVDVEAVQPPVIHPAARALAIPVNAGGGKGTARRRMPDTSGTVVQLPLVTILATYCDFRDSQAPSLSDHDREFLRRHFYLGKSVADIAQENMVSRQCADQTCERAVQRLTNDLLKQGLYCDFWKELHKSCIVSTDILAGVAQDVLGSRAATVNTVAIGHFLLHGLAREAALEWYRINTSRKVRCCRGTGSQLDALVACLHDVRSAQPGHVLTGNDPQVIELVCERTHLSPTAAHAAAGELIALLPLPKVADKLEEILTKHGAPMHHADLAKQLDEADPGYCRSPQQVLRILDMDARFAWAGLGTYALAAWGYPSATDTLGVVLYLIRAKGAGVTLDEVKEFMFTTHKYAIKPSSVDAALRMAEGKQLKRLGANIWIELRTQQ